MRTTKRLLAGAVLSAFLVAGAPTAALANHDCGPPDRHNDHSKGPDSRNRPCK